MTHHTVKSAGIAALVCVVVALRLATPLAAQPSSSRAASGLQRLLDAELARVPGTAGVWVKHLTTGEEAAVNADRVFNSASVIKIPVMLLAFQLADQGKLSLTERITIQAADVRGGSGVFRYHDAGLQPTLRDVLLQMIITSDNTATDLAIGKVGGIGPVNAMIKRAGYDPLQLTMTTGELFAKYGALQATQRDDKTINDPTFWLGSMTPRATGRMLEDIQRMGGVSKVGQFMDQVKDKNSNVKLMGFGHRVYKNYDPRAKLMQETCKEVLTALGLENDPLFKLAMALEKIALEDDYFVQRKLYPNVDFYSGIVQRAIGIPVSLFTAIFALARTVGWIAQLNEMIGDPEYKIGRPRQLFTGSVRRDVLPIAQR